MNLWMIYIGGIHEKALIELHDMRFAVAKEIEDTYEMLKKSWWGKPTSLHLDAWGKVEYADGYQVILRQEPPIPTDRKLYFVNLGGYDKNQFTELHKNLFVVAKTASKAKVRALKTILDWRDHHRDYQYEFDGLLNIDDVCTVPKGWYLHLEATDQPKEVEFSHGYRPIGKI